MKFWPKLKISKTGKLIFSLKVKGNTGIQYLMLAIIIKLIVGPTHGHCLFGEKEN